MAELNWVQARSRCSLAVIFKHLEAGTKSDVETISAIARNAKSPNSFAVSVSEKRIMVTRETFGAVASVEFSFDETEIRAATGDRVLRAIPALNEDAACRLVVEGGELELWQFRRMALEELFFKGA